MPLALTDTVTSIARANRERAKEARRAKIAGSRNNFEYLLNCGVICTPDDEMDRYYLDKHLDERAAKEGITRDEARERHDQERAEENVVSDLRWYVSRNETGEEHAARRGAILATAVGTKENGRPCNHATTKKEIGWINRVGFYTMVATDDAGNYPFRCCRCGAEADVPPVKEPTEQVKVAMAILAAAGK